MTHLELRWSEFSYSPNVSDYLCQSGVLFQQVNSVLPIQMLLFCLGFNGFLADASFMKWVKVFDRAGN